MVNKKSGLSKGEIAAIKEYLNEKNAKVNG